MLKIIFETDDKNRVIPSCDWASGMEPGPNEHVGEIEPPAYEEHAIPLWKWTGTACERRTAEEIQADIDDLPVQDPTPEEILRADVDYLLMLADEVA